MLLDDGHPEGERHTVTGRQFIKMPCARTASDRRRCVAIVATVVLGVCHGATAQTGRIENDLFEHRVEEYLELRRAAIADGGRLEVTRESTTLSTTVDDLARRIQRRRAAAREGDVFTPETAAVFRDALRSVFAGPGGAIFRTTVQEVQPRTTTLAVNGRYPGNEPRSTMPPQILAVLPRLPDPLSFRFVARDLVLIDRNTSVIVDVLRGALPPENGRRQESDPD